MLATDLKTGTIYKENNAPFLVLKYEHSKSARGGATVKVKVRNLITNQVLPKNYCASDKMIEADVARKNAQYLYKDGSDYIFMDPSSYEQLNISEDTIGSNVKFLKEGENVQVLYFEDNPVSVDLPITIVFEIKYTEPGYKGNTVTNVYKDATLENDTIIKVPAFIKIGDKVKVNTQVGEYVSKA